MRQFLMPIAALSIIFMLAGCGPTKTPSTIASKDGKDTLSSQKPPQTESKPTAKAPSPTRQHYETSIGNLKPQCLVVAGANMGVSKKGQFDIVSGLLFLKDDEAISITEGELNIYPSSKLRLSPARDLYLTLVQDNPTGKWIATKGFIVLADGKFQIIEGQTIRIVGGNNNPFKISNESFSDTVIRIQNGKPEILSAPFETAYQDDALKISNTVIRIQMEKNSGITLMQSKILTGTVID
jgi:hypothetical protein